MFSTIRARLMILLSMVSMAGIVILSLTNNYAMWRQNSKEADSMVHTLARSYAETIGNWVGEKKQILSAVKSVVEWNNPYDVIEAAQKAGNFEAVYIGRADGKYFGLEDIPNFDPRTRPWYRDAASARKVLQTLPYIDALTNKMIISVAIPIISAETNDIKAVVGADLKIDSVVEAVQGIRPTPGSYAFIVDVSGKVVIHHDEKVVLSDVDKYIAGLTPALVEQLEAEGISKQIRFNDVDYLAYVKNISGTSWNLVILANQDEGMVFIKEAFLSSMLRGSEALLLSILILNFMVLAVTRRLHVVKDALEDIVSGDGDLTRRLSVTGKDELAGIAIAFNHFIDKIASLMHDIRRASSSIEVTSSEITQGNMDLSTRTEQQSSSLENTSSEMTQLTTTVQSNADNAQEANKLAVSASDIATSGSEVVQQVIGTMNEIKIASQKIVEIIAVIDNIAFQTNILALNAAVEAARAGEQGRGFAVVAGEVRNLAQRSAGAAKEIKDLINDSTRKVQAGEQQVQRAGTTMAEVVESVRMVMQIVGNISVSSMEQSKGISEVGKSVVEMENVVQQNSAQVEQVAAASASLRDEAKRLGEVIALFKLDAASVPYGDMDATHHGHDA